MNSNSKNLLGNALFGLGAFTTAAGCLGGITTIVDYLNPDLLQRVKDLYLPDNADLALKFLTPITMGLGVASMLKGEKMINQSRVEKSIYKLSIYSCLFSVWI